MSNNILDIAKEIRLDIFKMFYVSRTGHLAPALSCVDILTELYFDNIIDTEKMFTANRDRVILSKGHACAALYAVLARAGYFSREELLSFYQKNSRLGGHPSISLPGIETATGALGHGICFGTGTAKASQLSGNAFYTYVIMGDGESEEGSVWEAAQFAANEKLDHLIVIMDRNRLQASTWVDAISALEPVRDKWQSFGWQVFETDGHDYSSLHSTLNEAKKIIGKPSLIIANTVKGKGFSVSENSPVWHSRAPKGEEWEQVCREYGITLEELGKI